MGTNKGIFDWVEKWLELIPGISAYRRRENLREIDHKLRQYISAQLQEIKSFLEKIILDLSWQKKPDMLPKINVVVSQFQQVADSIKFANYGYSGIFDLKKIREDELKKIYDFDLSLIEDLKKMQTLLEELEEIDMGDKWSEKVDGLQASLQAFDKKFHQRNDFLSQMVKN